MAADHYRRTTCRLCDSHLLALAVPMGSSPIGGAFVRSEDLNKPQALYPLDLFQCEDCGHVQLLDVVDPGLLFAGYTYFSGRTSLVKHFAEYAASVMSANSLAHGSFVVDIGSNDGAFLKFFQDAGMKVLGIDPAKNVAEYANAAGVETLPVMFDLKVTEQILNSHGPADIVTANNVFAHTDDLQGMAQSAARLLKPGGSFYFEVSYVLDVLDKLLLGTIFHEHLCYHSVKPLESFLKRQGLELTEVRRVPIQGGSLICRAQKPGGPRAVSGSVGELLALEEKRGVYRPGFFDPFNRRLAELKVQISQLLDGLAARRMTIAAYGAARGGTLITYLFELGRHLQYIVDEDPEKIGLFSPGLHLPVLAASAIYERRPDYVAILAWVHSQAIIKSNRRYLEEGGKFITFFPEITVVDKTTGL